MRKSGDYLQDINFNLCLLAARIRARWHTRKRSGMRHFMKGMWKFVTVTWHPLKTPSRAPEPYEQFIPVIIAESIFKSRFWGRKTWRANLGISNYLWMSWATRAEFCLCCCFLEFFYFLCLLIMSTSSRIHTRRLSACFSTSSFSF